jgi:two-component system KDP operon response regulator KdpE
MAASERTVLVVEDETPILRFLRSALQENGFRVIEALDGRSALELAVSRKPDMILLDLMLPDMDGLDVLKRLRQWTAAPVIILSARGQESDKITGLDAGADDYLTKPFGVDELLARMRVAFRHAEQGPQDQPPVYEHETLKVDLAVRRVWVRKKEVHLSPLQYDLLAVLVRNAGRVVGQKQLVKEVWHEAGDASPESVRICVHQLRHRIESDPVRPRHIKTEPGVGYRLEAPAEKP